MTAFQTGISRIKAPSLSMVENIILYKPIILFLGHWQPVQTMIRCCIMQYCTGLQIRVHTGKLFFLFLNQNICCGYSKEPSQWYDSFEHPKHKFKLMGYEINAILGAQFILIWTYEYSIWSSSPLFAYSKWSRNDKLYVATLNLKLDKSKNIIGRKNFGFIWFKRNIFEI